MNKKILAILLISVFLIVSSGFISAAEDGNDAGNASSPIKVKIVWHDDGNKTSRPDQVMVNLLQGGKVVEFIRLNESNSWNSTFNALNDSGNYKVELADDLSNYSVSYNGSAEKGFVINCTLKESPANASENRSSLEKNDTNNATDNKTDNDTNKNASDNKSSDSSNGDKKSGDSSKDDKKSAANVADGSNDDKKASASVENSSDSNKGASGEADNGSDSKIDDKTTNQTSNESKVNSTPQKDEPNNGTNIVKTSYNPVDNGEPQVTISKLKNTGLPIIAVSLMAILGGYAYLRYRK